MVFQILTVLVALSLPALLVIEEINSWQKSHKASEKRVASGTVPGIAAPEPSGAAQRTRGFLPAPQRKIA
jgi:hypothetical protein